MDDGRASTATGGNCVVSSPTAEEEQHSQTSSPQEQPTAQQEQPPLTTEEEQMRLAVGEENWRKIQAINEEARRKKKREAELGGPEAVEEEKKKRKGKKPGPKKGWKKNAATGAGNTDNITMDKTWLALGDLWNIAFNVEEAATGLAKVSATIYSYLEDDGREISKKEKEALRVVNKAILNLIETRRQLYDVIPQEEEYKDWVKAK